jgi:hypothetical protein
MCGGNAEASQKTIKYIVNTYHRILCNVQEDEDGAEEKSVQGEKPEGGGRAKNKSQGPGHIPYP